MTTRSALGLAQPQVLKQDLFGRILRVTVPEGARIRRDLAGTPTGMGWLARLLAGNEARSLRRLDGLAGFPGLLAWDGRRLERSWIDGQCMARAMPREPAYYRRAHRLLRAMHRRGVAHNDLAKEANWLVTPEGQPALVDFQLAWRAHPRNRFLRLLAREDLRHLLKHKRTYCPDLLTPVERRLLARHSWIRRLWFATGKPLYRFITRRLLGWRDNEGKGPPTT